MTPLNGLPYRGRFGDERPPELQMLRLPPDRLPSHQRWRALKAWRYIGVFGPEFMLCLASARIGPAAQSFWALWDRRATGHLYERTTLGRRAVTLQTGLARARGRDVVIEVELEETAGIETVCRTGASYAWTRKQGGIPARCVITVGGERHNFHAHAIVDDTAAYYERHTAWRWCAGVGTATDGRALAWNLVQGVNDPPRNSERTVWLDGEPQEVGPAAWAPDLSAVGRLRFSAEAQREQDQNLGLIRSHYRQPFGAFAGELLPGVELDSGYGVMEEHDVRW